MDCRKTNLQALQTRHLSQFTLHTASKPGGFEEEARSKASAPLACWPWPSIPQQHDIRKSQNLVRTRFTFMPITLDFFVLFPITWTTLMTACSLLLGCFIPIQTLNASREIWEAQVPGRVWGSLCLSECRKGFPSCVSWDQEKGLRRGREGSPAPSITRGGSQSSIYRLKSYKGFYSTSKQFI